VSRAAGRGIGRRLVQWAVCTEGSTRSSALIRIGLAALLWSCWANALQLFRDSGPLAAGVSLAFFASSTLMFVGLCSRAATAAAAAVALTLYYYFGVHLGRTEWTYHHEYLLAFATFLCALTPCGRSYSLDRWLAVRRAARACRPAPAERGNLWGLRLIACQLSLVYFWSAYDKTNLGFLSGERVEYMVMLFYTGSMRPAWPGAHALMPLLGLGTVALEYGLAFGMLCPTTRRWLVFAGLAFHTAIYLTLPVGTFSLTMCCLYLSYFDADAVHRAIDELAGTGALTGARAH
jgi:HTTM domain